ncbi:hypothetical protein EVG20_g2169 [Dentipellis fragilis]|uniref:Uncharacterized protein n=1 Tax=Dentipellis fragilis TaxID=205917 RepID=A0A4Y9ZAF0_9AGAM|nr:hypothetical protein EVG20_g2169 [Dentipellis fragilis]
MAFNSGQTLPQNAVSSLTFQIGTKAGPVFVQLPRQPVPLDLVNEPKHSTRDEQSIASSTYPNGPPIRAPSQLPAPGNLNLSCRLGKRIAIGEASVLYTLELDDAMQASMVHIPPLMVKIARPNRTASLAREAWFYEEMECLQGVAVARCYGWFEAEIPRNSLPHTWKTKHVPRVDEELDVGGLENERSNGAPHEMLEDRCWRPNHLSILLMERLGERIPPLDQPMSMDMKADIESIFEDVAHLGIDVRSGLRYENILLAPTTPPGLPSLPSPYTNRTHAFRLVNFDQAFKSGFNVWRIKGNLLQPLARMFEEFEEDRRAFWDIQDDKVLENSQNWDIVYHMADTDDEYEEPAKAAKLAPSCGRVLQRQWSQRQVLQAQLSQSTFGSQPFVGSQPTVGSQFFVDSQSFVGSQPAAGSQPFASAESPDNSQQLVYWIDDVYYRQRGKSVSGPLPFQAIGSLPSSTVRNFISTVAEDEKPSFVPGHFIASTPIVKILQDTIGFKEDTSGPLSWIVVTHVCRRWRRVALGAAVLWSTILCSHHSWKEFIARAQEAPLSVWLNLSGSSDVQIAQSVLPNLLRIRHLYLRGPKIVDVITLSCLSGQAPLLETLMLEYEPPRKIRAKIDGDILSSLFGGSVPRLDRLSLTGIPIRADSHLFSENLTWLDITGCDIDPTVVRLPLADLINVLLRLPLLETLSIDGIVADPVSSDLLDGSLADIPVAHMAHLEVLSAYTEYPLIHKAFMAHLSAPELVMCGMGTFIESRDELTPPFVPPLISWTDPNSFLSMDIEEYPTRMMICGGLRHALNERMELVAPMSISVMVHLQEGFPELDEAIYDVSSQMPLHIVRSLQLFYTTYPIDWAPLLMRMDAIEEITTFITRWKDILQVMTMTVVDNGPMRLLCPKLKKLKFLTLNYSPKSEVFYEALAIAVEMRRESGSELEVIIDEESIPSHSVEELGALRHRRLPSFRQRILRRLAFK